MLDVPYIPPISRADRFRGRTFHSSDWDHSSSLAGERVASIGTGASAIQYVPEIAAEVAHLTVFQRTPIWVSPRYDEPFTAEQQELFARDPEEALKVRDAAFQAYEEANFNADSEMTKGLTDMAREYLARKVADPELRAKLTPSYPVGCKRPLQSRVWFPTFARPNVTLETSPIVEFTEHGLRTADGVDHRFDTVIYGTGFHAADYLRSLDVYGTGGRRLRDDWRDGAEAYLGTVVPGYPNLFTLYGPNTNGVTSIIYILEAQAEFVRRMLDDMAAAGVTAVDVERDVHDAYNAEIQRAMEGTVWLANCNNYYRHPNGKVVTQFPYSGTKFVEMLAGVTLDDFEVSPAGLDGTGRSAGNPPHGDSDRRRRRLDAVLARRPGLHASCSTTPSPATGRRCSAQRRIGCGRSSSAIRSTADTGIVELVRARDQYATAPAPSDVPAFGFFLLSLQRDVDATLATLAGLGFDDGVRRIEMPAPGGKKVAMAVITAPDGVRVELIGPPQ